MEEGKDAMEGSGMTDCDINVHVALEHALQNVGLGDDDERVGSEGDEVSSGGESENEGEATAALNARAAKRLDSNLSNSDCMFQSKPCLSTSYRHAPPPRPSEPPANKDVSCRSPAVSNEMKLGSLTSIVEDDRAFLMFRRFLKDQCITRNLNFWLACEHYRLLPASGQNQLQKVARAVYVKFIKYSAPQKVSILDQTKKTIKMALELHTPLTPFLYDKAQQETWQSMERNEYQQFLVSDIFADCFQFTGMEVAALDTFHTLTMSQPAVGVCGGGSLQLSGSEDSASVTSFNSASDEGGPRSVVYNQLARPNLSGGHHRQAMSDTEARPRCPHPIRPSRHVPRGPMVTKGNSTTDEEFVELIRERLVAVQLDRDSLRRKMQDQARKKGQTYDEIMAIEWYDHPDVVKYQVFDEDARSKSPTADTKATPSAAKHVLSPTSHSPPHTPQPSAHGKKPTRAHINSLASREAQEALRDLEITNQVNKRRRAQNDHLFGSTCSSLLSVTSDSGVGDAWGTGASDGWYPQTSGGTTPLPHVTAYIREQDMANHAMGERDRMVQAAAITLISNTPKPEALKPRVPGLRDQQRRPPRTQEYVHNYPGAYTSDDSSSCYTMTSKSSTSDLFIPRRPRYPPTMYSDSEDSHYYPHHNRYQMRRLTTPKRSHQPQSKHTPSSVPAPKIPPAQSTSSRPSGDVLVVYHLDDFPTPYAKRIGGSEITLGEFKELVFARRGDYRYFFKSFCEDLSMEIMEEITDDSIVLPLTQGKIVGKVEKV